MWMIDPRILCDKHLLGEHVEIHKLIGCLKKSRSIQGYLKNGLIEPSQIIDRHDRLAWEMRKRWFNHESPAKLARIPRELMDMPKIVDMDKSLQDLLERCPRCRERYAYLQEIIKPISPIVCTVGQHRCMIPNTWADNYDALHNIAYLEGDLARIGVFACPCKKYYCKVTHRSDGSLDYAGIVCWWVGDKLVVWRSRTWYIFNGISGSIHRSGSTAEGFDARFSVPARDRNYLYIPIINFDAWKANKEVACLSVIL